jgi:low-density lipoprotein receptor-related protein 1B
MYWSDWSESQTAKTGKIERASMDGTGRQVFIETDLKWPNGLSLDMAGKKLYWCDAYFNKIERISLDGSQREVLNIFSLLVLVY